MGRIAQCRWVPVYRGVARVYEGTDLKFQDTGLQKSTAYTYQVSAFNKAGEGPKSGTIHASTTATQLHEVSDDTKWVGFLPGKWGYYYQGKGFLFYSWNLTFEASSNIMGYNSFSNPYETIASTKSLDISYPIKIEKNIIYKLVVDKYEKFARIEKVSDDEMRVYNITETSSTYSESPAELYTKIGSIETSKDNVIASADLKNVLGGIWSYQNSFYKNTIFDFSANKNFYLENYEIDGAKRSTKYEYKISSDGVVSMRPWAGTLDPSWKKYKIVVESPTKMKWYTGAVNEKPAYSLIKQ